MFSLTRDNNSVETCDQSASGDRAALDKVFFRKFCSDCLNRLCAQCPHQKVALILLKFAVRFIVLTQFCRMFDLCVQPKRRKCQHIRLLHQIQIYETIESTTPVNNEYIFRIFPFCSFHPVRARKLALTGDEKHVIQVLRVINFSITRSCRLK